MIKLLETLNSDNIWYHGTTIPLAKKIIKEGFKLTAKNNAVDAYGKGVYLSNPKLYGLDYDNIGAYVAVNVSGLNSYIVEDENAVEFDVRQSDKILPGKGYDSMIVTIPSSDDSFGEWSGKYLIVFTNGISKLNAGKRKLEIVSDDL